MFNKKELYLLWNLGKIKDRNNCRIGEIGLTRDEIEGNVKKKYVTKPMLDILYYYCVTDYDQEYLENDKMKIRTSFSHYDVIKALGSEITEFEHSLIKHLGKGVLNDRLGNLGLMVLWNIYEKDNKQECIDDLTNELIEDLEYELHPIVSVFESYKVKDIVGHYYNRIEEVYKSNKTAKNIVNSIKDINLEMLVNVVKLVNENNNRDWFIDVEFKGNKIKGEVTSLNSDDSLSIYIKNKDLSNLFASLPGQYENKNGFFKINSENEDFFYGELEYCKENEEVKMEIKHLRADFIKDNLNNEISVYYLPLRRRRDLDGIITEKEWKAKGCIIEDECNIIIPLDLKFKLNPVNKKGKK